MNRYGVGVVILSVSHWAALCLPTVTVAQGADRYQLGVLDAGEIVDLPLDAVIAPTRLLVLVDGVATTAPFAVAGRTLSLRLPDELPGAIHRIVVYELTPEGRRYIGNWEFETTTGGWSVIGTVMTEAGIRGTKDRNETYASGGGRLDFDLNEGRLRGGLSFAMDERLNPVTGGRISVGDWFIEARSALVGETMKLRFGTHYFDNDSQSFDQGSRRGVSARIGDPSGNHETTVFAIQATQASGAENLLGLADPDDRLGGFVSTFRPVEGASLRVTLAGYGGRDTDLPHGSAGAVNGRGLAVSGALGSRGDFLFAVDGSRWHDGQNWRQGHSYSLDTRFDIAPAGLPGGLVFDLAYARTDADFHAPLNRDLFTGEETLTLGLTRHGWDWEWSGDVMVGRTNIGGAPALPVDRLMRLGMDVTYSPDVFTGGFLNGTSFFAGVDMSMQDRIETPAGAVAPTDNTTYGLYLGLSRLQRDQSLALLYTHDRFEDRTGARQHHRIHGLETVLTYSPTDWLETSFASKIELTDGPAGRVWTAQGTGATRIDLIADRLAFDFEFGVETSTDPAAAEGGYLGNALSWSLSDSHRLVLSADYGSGSKQHGLIGEDGWIFGLALRSDFDIARYR